MAEQPPRTADGRRAAAVFTIVREEAVFLPIWLRYYAAHFPPEDIYVLHHVVPGGPEDRCGPLAPDPLACRARVHAPVAPRVRAAQRLLLGLGSSV
jgi:hypothetical protein